MIAMRIISTYDEYRRDRHASALACPAPAHPVRQAMLRVLSLVGLGIGGIAAMDDEVPGMG